MEKLKIIDQLKKVAIFLRVFVLGVALGAFWGKAFNQKRGRKCFFPPTPVGVSIHCDIITNSGRKRRKRSC